MTDAATERPTQPPGNDAGRAGVLRAELVKQLRVERKITSPAVEAAFLAVRREHFLPAGTPLETAYGYDNSVVTKRDEGGTALSSVSAAYIQARMLEQADLRPGMRVLEIGSGGLNAALIAEIVGDQGHVVTVDIDPDVTARAAKLLDEAGYSRVRVLVADADDGVPNEEAFDAIIVTVGAWDVSPSWLRQLAPDGALVLPLVMNGVTRTVGLRRDGDHLVSTSIEVAGFVPMQGIGRHDERLLAVAGPDGKKVTLRFDTGAPEGPAELDGVLATGPVESWSGVLFPPATSWADLYLWLAWYLPGFCRLVAEDGSVLSTQRGWYPFGGVRGSGLAVFVTRPAPDGEGVEFGARAYGRDGERAAAALVEQIRAWDRDGRSVDEPSLSYWPHGSDQTQVPADAAAMSKTHGIVTISWPSKG
ncbi:methyltransferase, FxLD system [Actinoplanes missouriensis]|uniref:methyltransferase, FxLD system n=1 Tax=Actinoplanes missouriensis TaxID=1866 RepID=UPI0033CAF182